MAKLTINIGAKIDGMKKGLANAQSRVGKFVGKVKAKFGGVATAMAGAFAAGAAARGLNNLIAKADDIGKISARLGLTAEAYQKMTFAARRAGATTEDIEKAVKRMQSTITDAERGLTSATDAFDALGISVEDLKGKSPEEQFSMIAAAMNGIEDAALKGATAQDVFGRSGTALIPMLETYQSLKQEAEELGGILSNETVKAAESLKDSMENVSTSMLALVANSGIISWLDDITLGAAEAATALKSLDAGGMSEGETINIAAPTAEEIKAARDEGLDSGGSKRRHVFDASGALENAGATITLETPPPTAQELAQAANKPTGDAGEAALKIAERMAAEKLASEDRDAFNEDMLDIEDAGFDQMLKDLEKGDATIQADKEAAVLAEEAAKKEAADKLKQNITNAFQAGGKIQSRLASIGGDRTIVIDPVQAQMLNIQQQNLAVNERIAIAAEADKVAVFPST